MEDQNTSFCLILRHFVFSNVMLNVAGNCETIVETGVERVSLRGRRGDDRVRFSRDRLLQFHTVLPSHSRASTSPLSISL